MLEYQPGDVFLVKSDNVFSMMVNSIQKWWSYDDKSIYTHAGIVLDKEGNTFEALFWGTAKYHISRHIGKPCMYVRHEFMNPMTFEKAFERIKYHDGLMYPVHRLFLHLLPPLAKSIGGKMAVCSELVGQFLYNAELLHYWKGINPDHLEEIFRYWKYYNIIYEDIL